MSSRRLLATAGLACILCAGLASAQSPFQLTVTQQQGNAFVVANGSTLSFNDPVGTAETIHVTAVYLGFGQVSITQTPQLAGSAAFTVNFVEKLPLTLDNGGRFAFDIRYLPTATTLSSALLNFFYIETLVGGPPNFTPTSAASSVSLGLQGTAPSYVLSYILPSDLNVVVVPPGGSVVFPPAQVNTTSVATFNITNRGSGAGKITGVSVTGSPFKVVGQPLYPLTLSGGQTLQLGLQYVPSTAMSDTGQLQVMTDTDTVLTVALQGGGFSTGSILAYQVLNGTNSTPVVPSGTITLPGANVGETSSVVIQVKNIGNANATINSVSLAGAGFQLGDPAPVLPVTLALNSSVSFTIRFTPARPGNIAGRLTVGSDTFNLDGIGLGSNLVFSYVSGDTKVPLSNNTLVFSPVTVSASSQLNLVVSNSGTLPARIANIGIGETNSPFSLSNPPTLPATIDPGAEIRFPITYTPVTTGFTNGTLRLDATTINLVGSGAAPPPVPSYTIQGPTGNVAPLSQPSVRLSLSRGYPIAIAGTLTMIVTGGQADPAVQFSTGGRTVSFSIPANSTDAVFAGQGTQIRLQSGTAAATITLTPTFSTQAGLSLTSESSGVLQFSVAAAAPTLISGRVSTVSATGFTVVVTGYSTPRTLTTMDVKFTPLAGFNLPQTQFTIDLRQASTLWFQNSASQAFGGQFAVAMPFSVRGATQSALEGISSLSITVSNETGASNAVVTSQ